MNNHLPLRRSLFIWRANKYLWAQNKKSVSCKIQVSCKNYCKPNKAPTCTIYRLIASRQVGHYQYSLNYKFIDAYTKPIFVGRSVHCKTQALQTWTLCKWAINSNLTKEIEDVCTFRDNVCNQVYRR